MFTIEELHNMGPKELQNELALARLELYKVRLSHSNGQLKEMQKLKLYRSYIARLQTLANYAQREAVKKSISKS